MELCARITLTLDGNDFDIERDEPEGSPVTINGFPVTAEEYQKALDGETVTLSADGRTAVLVSTDGNVTFDGKSLTNFTDFSISRVG